MIENIQKYVKQKHTLNKNERNKNAEFDDNSENFDLLLKVSVSPRPNLFVGAMFSPHSTSHPRTDCEGAKTRFQPGFSEIKMHFMW